MLKNVVNNILLATLPYFVASLMLGAVTAFWSGLWLGNTDYALQYGVGAAVASLIVLLIISETSFKNFLIQGDVFQFYSIGAVGGIGYLAMIAPILKLLSITPPPPYSYLLGACNALFALAGALIFYPHHLWIQSTKATKR